MKQNNSAAAVAKNYVYMQRVAKVICAIVLGLFFMLLFSAKSFGQSMQKGQESKKGEMNFSEVAKHFKEHPQKLKRMKLENEEDEEKRPRPQPVSDPSLIRKRAAQRSQEAPMGGGVPSGATPVASAPAALFEATLDNGTSIPPDTHGAVDSNYCVTALNTSVRIQTKAGAVLSTVTLNQFWLPVLSGGGSFDPRVHYDPYANRWFIVAVSGANSTSSSLLIAVSKTSNPTSGWWMYKIIADPTGTRWLDYPNVGFNKKWLTVTGNLFGSSYGGAKVYVFNKAALMSGSGAPYTAVVQSTSFTICPAFTYDNTQENMFAVESWNGGSGYMRLWKISGPVGAETMTTVAYPTTVNKWRNTGSSSDFAPQLGTTSKIQTNDDRVTQMVFMNNKLWFAHAVFLPYSTTTLPTRSSIQWWQTDTMGAPLQIGRIDDPSTGKFYAFPTMAVNTNNDAVIGFSQLSASTYASAGYAVRMHTDPIDYIGPVVIYKAGGSSYYKTYGGSRNRWGDYSSTVLDPATNNFWTIQEVASATANVWDTWWANINVTGGCTVAAIAGASAICSGTTTAFTDATAGGTWSSSNTAVATVNSAGTVTGVGAGTATITYAISGCSATKVISVNAAPTTIGGSASICAGTSTPFTNTVTGGTWSSSNAAVATVASTGVVNGIAAGTATITYSTGIGCNTTKVITINAVPAAISGTPTVCVGGTTALTNTTAGGIWASSNAAVASVGATGVVSGMAAGTATITYTAAGGCYKTIVVTVSGAPSAGIISGATAVSTGSAITLTPSVSGGAWSSSNASIATVSGTGVVTGMVAGAVNITYSVSNSCGTAYAVKAITVSSSNIAPAFAGGATQSLNVCQNAAATSINTLMAITDGNSGQTETWTIVTTPAHGTLSGFTATAISTGATVTPAGLSYTPTAGYSGTDAFTVKISDGYATATTTVNVNITALPSAGTISGSSSVPTGATIGLTTSVGGGSWSSSNAAVATVGATGIVSGVAAGTANITYTVSNACGTAYAVKAITVTATTTNVAPAFTGGPSQTLSVCQNAAATSINTKMSVSDANIGQTETWSIVSGPSHGIVSGFSTSATSTGGTITPGGLSYTPTAGYSGTDAFTVQVSDGYATAATTINVNITALPNAGTISGASTVSAGATIGLTSSVGSGSWSSSNTTIATVGATGAVSGVAAGTANITYMVSNACGSAYAVKAVTVTAATVANATPVFTGGASQTLSVCQNTSATSISAKLAISDANAGQTETWSIVSGPSHGSVSGLSTTATSTGGTITPAGINYTPAYGYSGTDAFTVKISDGIASSTTVINVTIAAIASAGTISGPSTMPLGTAATLTSSVAGGTWSSGTPSIATVNATTGYISAVGTGNVVISYKVTTACGSATATFKIRVSKSTTGRGSGAPEATGTNGILQPSVTVYPNPTHGQYTLIAPAVGKFYLFNVEGNLVGTYNVVEGNNFLTIASGLQPGVYIGKFSNEDGSITSSVRISYKL
jgi:uncharacterized protein YjdB